MKKHLVAIIGLAIAISISSVSCYANGMTWKIGHVRSEGSSVDIDVRELTEEISRKTSGQIKFDIYPASKLGDYSVVQERCSFGEVEMYIGPFGTSIDKRLALPAVPYLVKDWKAAQKVFSSDSLLMKKMASYLEPQNIKLLGGWPVYFGGIMLTKKPEAPNDPSVKKNMIIRVPPINSFKLTAKALGYTPYPITWVYARSGLESGMVEGLIGGGAEGYLGLSKYGKYYLAINDHFEHWLVYMNLDLWNSLSDQDQKVVLSAVKTMERERFQVAEQEEKQSLAKLENAGVEVVRFNDQDINKIRQKIVDNVWPRLERETGEDFSSFLE